MKTANQKAKKSFDAVKFMRKQRKALSKKLSKMTKAEIIEYYQERKSNPDVKPSA
jgi:hypothetical protein